MRLLNTTTLKLSDFDDSIPPYAILSHTWGPEEVLFADIQGGSGANKFGFKKLEGCCKKAAADRFEWVWIDTCCIDKSSSAELSEAINSMYQWYKDSVICYVYLQDIFISKGAAKPQPLPHYLFSTSRWFTRGWTLQELIAPRILEFYDAEWREIGTKASLSKQISKITGIPIPVLRGEDVSTCTVAHRMSWASGRQTTREEAIAYCLLGLFGVNMPMLYGEGRKSFQRLQGEILKQNEDYTLFAWSLHDDCSAASTGLLASCPADFSDSTRIEYDEQGMERNFNLITLEGLPGPEDISRRKDYKKIVSVDQSNIEEIGLMEGVPASLFSVEEPPQQTSRGIKIRLPLREAHEASETPPYPWESFVPANPPDEPYMAWIYCFLEDRPVCVFVDRLKSAANLFARFVDYRGTRRPEVLHTDRHICTSVWYHRFL